VRYPRQDREYRGWPDVVLTAVRDIIRHRASYVDRLLRGAKPAELPLRFPTKFELVVSRKIAKAMGPLKASSCATTS
jgi:ABC-type uncharacterized transport system substrate-binding protein